MRLELGALERRAPYKETRDRVLREFERIYLGDLFEHTGGNVALASREAKMDRNYLTQLLDRHGLRKR